MARAINKLTARKVDTVKAPGRHSDGAGLYLVVEPSGSKHWVFLYRWKRPGARGAGKPREMGLGSLLKVGLSEAREKAADARKLLGDQIDPLERKVVPTSVLAEELLD